MATIRKLTRKPSSNRSLWQAQVRKKGMPPLSKCAKAGKEHSGRVADFGMSDEDTIW